MIKIGDCVGTCTPQSHGSDYGLSVDGREVFSGREVVGKDTVSEHRENDKV